MTRPARAVLTMAAGVVCAMGLLEGGLRVAGMAAAARTRCREANADAPFCLLCIGDSYTYGAGAPPAASYPAQLEALIRMSSTAEVVVINAGIPAANTAQLRRNLDVLLARHRPRAVLLLAGGANGWNFWGCQADGMARHRIADALYRVRVFKLAKLLLRAAGDQHRTGRRAHLEQQRYEEVYQQFSRLHAKHPEDGQPYYEMGAFYLREKNFEQAAHWFREGIQRDGNNSSNYFGLGNALQMLGQHEEAIATWWRGCRSNAFDAVLAERIGRTHLTHGNHADAYAALAYACERDPGWYETRVTLSMLGRLAPGYQAHTEGLLQRLPPARPAETALPELIMPVDMQQATPPARAALLAWVARDLEAMRQACVEHDATLVILNYPLRHFHHAVDGPNETENFYNAVNELLASFAARHALPFVNNRVVFDTLFGRKMSMFFLNGADEHPNAAGYGLLASNVYATLSAYGITP